MTETPPPVSRDRVEFSSPIDRGQLNGDPAPFCVGCQKSQMESPRPVCLESSKVIVYDNIV